MFGIGQTYSAKLTFDATTGLPTGVTSAVKESILSGTVKGLTSIITDDEVVVGTGRLAAVAIAAYGAANFAAKQKTGAFALNPWAKG